MPCSTGLGAGEHREHARHPLSKLIKLVRVGEVLYHYISGDVRSRGFREQPKARAQ